jgi:hypothetical protein
MRAVFSRTPTELLDKFLRGELAAAATYERAVDHVDDARTRAALERCRRSHADRAVMLAQQIEKRGFEPSPSAGPWGAFTKALETGAAAFGEEAVLKVLLAGEKNGLEQYETDTLALDENARNAVQDVLVSEQVRTAKEVAQLAGEAI